MLPESPQSTNHILLIEPAVFYANPETMDSNAYQVQTQVKSKHITDETKEEVYQKALAEFNAFRELLAGNGVRVTTLKGSKACPDHIFPNWVSTHNTEDGGGMILYPMLNENRRKERTPEMVNTLQQTYNILLDMSHYEARDRCLEANGSLCLDRANKIAYAARSSRTDTGLAREWAEKTGYDLVLFDTEGTGGKPVYHTDLVMWIGTEVAAICAEAITQKHRQQVVDRLQQTHQVVELSRKQMDSFCGNALEVRNTNDEKMLVMSAAAYNALSQNQKTTLGQHFIKCLHSPIPTIEQHGGGSARCLMLEMF